VIVRLGLRPRQLLPIEIVEIIKQAGVMFVLLAIFTSFMGSLGFGKSNLSIQQLDYSPSISMRDS